MNSTDRGVFLVQVQWLCYQIFDTRKRECVRNGRVKPTLSQMTQSGLRDIEYAFDQKTFRTVNPYNLGS